MHTRQDRWIQKELAFTPAKNATQPNPFKIIPIQPARKENNRETEETLARAAVTLETERAKWPNPWCLWLWWWRHGRARLPLDGFSWNLIPENISQVCRKNSSVIKICQDKEYFHEDRCTVMVSRWILLWMRNVSEKKKVVEKVKIHILCSVNFLFDYRSVFFLDSVAE